MAKITLFTSSKCQPCREVVEAIKANKVSGSGELELVEIDSDEGFERFRTQVLEHGDGAVPSAYREGVRCNILMDDESGDVVIDCPEETGLPSVTEPE